MEVMAPIKIPTPYGGQLLWVMPGGNLLFVHMKDKAKIRHRKRWSQVLHIFVSSCHSPLHAPLILPGVSKTGSMALTLLGSS